MQHYAFDLLENLTGKGVNVAHLQSLSLSKVVQYESYTAITAWVTVLGQLSQICIWKGT